MVRPPSHSLSPLTTASPLVVCQASLRALTGAAGLVARQCLAVVAHKDQVRASTLLPSGVPLELDWLAALAAPIANFFSPEGHERVLALLRLHHHVSRPASGDFDALSTPAKRAAAFELARTLPFFDRDLTAYYTAASPIAEEYELRVAHSLMRLEPADRAYEPFIAERLPRWREETGLLHVLAVLAAHMPSASDDWHYPSTAAAGPLPALLKTLPLARSYDAAARCIADFIAGAPPQSVARTLDAAAVIMRVKSNPHPSGSYCLEASLRGFPHPEACRVDPDCLPVLWAGLKTSLERALPPSALITDDPVGCW
jgi:hypothetical protein